MSPSLLAVSSPLPYSSNIFITWFIRVAVDSLVRLQLVDLDLDFCNKSLSIYDRKSVNGNVIARGGCSIFTFVRTKFQSTNSSMFVSFMSEDSRKG